MGLFDVILDKLGFSDSKVKLGEKTIKRMEDGFKPPVTQTQEVAKPVEIPLVDVMARLEELAKANPQKLNWKTSIVDLLKLLGIDSSFSARKELAIELGCPEEKMKDSAQMNMWLHKTVLKKIAENGGNIPKELLD
ncbi:MAG: DUF3597 domain-containing protein [Thermoanaerobaculaceae bacterium]|nr:DUF3597 domain-containing protein [Thermoanaerobaculaceae bacterium]